MGQDNFFLLQNVQAGSGGYSSC